MTYYQISEKFDPTLPLVNFTKKHQFSQAPLGQLQDILYQTPIQYSSALDIPISEI